MTHDPKSGRFRAGLVQLCSGRDVARNIKDASDLVRQAADSGAHYIQTPENTGLMELDQARMLVELVPEANNPALAAFGDLARELKIFLHIGSLGIRLDSGRIANRSFLFKPDGSIAARYDKIHMFDVDLGGGEIYCESASYAAGRDAVIAQLPWGPLGMTICYDLRFPALYRALAKAGATFLAVPAAFTRVTGEAHWHTLLRARAIEAQCFVFAAAQGGRHENGRETFGHSLIISPWGEILAEAGTTPSVVVADVDMTALDEARRRVPSLDHDRHFDVVVSQADAT